MHISALLYNTILVVSIMILCSYASYTDCKYGKVFNKNIVIFLFIGVTINCTYLSYLLFENQVEKLVFFKYYINLIISIGTSYFFYRFKIWAAGDAKLYFTILFLLPYNLIIDNSLNIFPGFFLLVFIFSISFIYILLETIVFLAKDLGSQRVNKSSYLNMRITIEWAQKCLFAYLISTISIELLVHYNPQFYSNNKGLILLLNIFLISITINLFKGRSILYAIISLVLTFLVIKIFAFPIVSNSMYVNINSIITLLLVIIIRYLGTKYNYKEILIDDVREGMVLSFDTILLFNTSKIKGLPDFTTETTDSRINNNHVESIKKWGKSKALYNNIRIVRLLPFAPFISVGTAVFLSIKIYIFFLR